MTEYQLEQPKLCDPYYHYNSTMCKPTMYNTAFMYHLHHHHCHLIENEQRQPSEAFNNHHHQRHWQYAEDDDKVQVSSISIFLVIVIIIINYHHQLRSSRFSSETTHDLCFHQAHHQHDD